MILMKKIIMMKKKKKLFENFFETVIDKDIEYSNDIFDKYTNLLFVLKYINISNKKNEIIPISKNCIFKDIINIKNNNNIIISDKDKSIHDEKNKNELSQKEINNNIIINNNDIVNNNENLFINNYPNFGMQNGNDSDIIGYMEMTQLQYNSNNRNINENNNLNPNYNNNKSKSKTENTRDPDMNGIAISINITKDKEDKKDESKNNLNKIFIIWNAKFLKKNDNNNYYLTNCSSSETIDLFSFFQKIYENNFKKIDIYKCFEEFSKEEIFDKDNLWKCSKCHENIAAKNKIEIYQIPKILIIQLKRFENNQKIENCIEFPIKNLDISNLAASSKSKNDEISKKYDLFAVANHYGRLEYGHYDAFCLNYINNKWYEFNDRHVNEIKEENKENSIVTKNAYVLFYRQQNNDLIDWDKIYKKKFYDIHENNMKKYEEDFIYKKIKQKDIEIGTNYQKTNNLLNNIIIEENEDTHSLDDLSLSNYVYNPFRESYLRLKRHRK